MATDDFNRADSGTLGANWASQTSFALDIVSNKAAGGSGDIHSDYYIGTFSNDQYSQAVVGGIGGSNYPGVTVRCSAVAETYYLLYIDPSGNGVLRRTVAAVETDLQALSGTFVNGDVVRIEVSGTTITGKRNGVDVGSTTDANIASGNPGLWAYGTPTLDDWEGGDLAASGEVAATPHHNPDNTFGPAISSRLGGVLQ